eukprot:scaffold2480_cov198-Chaetoceros_neogracile.AAC.1
MMVTPILTAAATASSFPHGKSVLTIRPFSSKVDSSNLLELCKDVRDGTDYLPKVAPLFEADPSCDFIIMEDEEGTMVAAGNRRNFDKEGSIIWIEAVRVSTQFKGKSCHAQAMTSLPGWASTDVDRNADNLLRALGVEHLISDDVKTDSWLAVESEEELKELLLIIKSEGGIGELPGL